MGACSFLLLASAERQPLFDEVLEGYACHRVASVLEAVKQCISDPPAAVLMDLASTLHSGVSETAPLYDLGIDLPILRCTGGNGAPWVAMCQAPFKRDPLSKALTEICAGDASWKHPVNMRKFVRINQNARIWFRRQGSPEWRRANCQSMSVSGLFLMTLDPEPVGTEIDLRILDTGVNEVAASGTVIWNHKWEDGSHTPGSGVNFDRSTVPESFRDFLANSFFSRRRS